MGVSPVVTRPLSGLPRFGRGRSGSVILLESTRPKKRSLNLWKTISKREKLFAAITLLAVLAPSLCALAVVGDFHSQDGPAHLYNARILLDSRRADSPFRSAFEVRWQPLPNWAGHLLAMLVLTISPPRIADAILSAVTLLAVAAMFLALRLRVAKAGLFPSALICGVLSINVLWLFGFTSFLLGACLFAGTLAFWWKRRNDFTARQCFFLSFLLILGYFCHPVSLGLTIVGLAILSVATPGPGRGVHRSVSTLASLVPLVPLGVYYRLVMRAGGGIEPVWGHWKRSLSPTSWWSQLGWIDPISLGSKAIAPFCSMPSRWLGIFAPAFWFLAGLAIAIGATLVRRQIRDERRGWLVLAIFLIVLGMIAPDTLGPNHGNYLPQRIVWLGLAALVPWLELDINSRAVRLATALFAIALCLQTAFVWEYAKTSDRLTREFVREVEPWVGKDQKVGTLLIDIRGRFRSNPLLHADCLLGLDTGNIIWSDYETVHYYFPVHLLDANSSPPAHLFEKIAVMDDPADRARRARLWRDLLDSHHDQIEVIIVLGDDLALIEETTRWYRQVHREGPARVFRR